MVEITTLPKRQDRAGYGFEVWITDGLTKYTVSGIYDAVRNTIARNEDLQKMIYVEIRKGIVELGPELTKKAVQALLSNK